MSVKSRIVSKANIENIKKGKYLTITGINPFSVDAKVELLNKTILNF